MQRRLTIAGNDGPKPESPSKGLMATEPILRKTPKTGDRKQSVIQGVGSSLSKSSNLSKSGDRKISMIPSESSLGSRPSIAGLLASRRFSKRMFQKFHKEEATASSTVLPSIEQEPTYKMEPDKKFSSAEVEKVIKQVLYPTLNGMKYSPKLCCNIMKILSDDIKKRVKELGYPRYKIVCILTLGEIKDQCAAVTSRCTWDPKVDNYASHTFKSKYIWCTGTVYVQALINIKIIIVGLIELNQVSGLVDGIVESAHFIFVS
ncbi:hypothetical protein KUTeg_016918 [Tegillarca granosa]|uniref:Uncharacterized protein n=1 Tax=Tegillarca granosa TaxID=220873 RepID=A0ABQ9ESW1_TEGGR|nr:hypothetical protein KUTeg_016918 [Tegillarca granosa]